MKYAAGGDPEGVEDILEEMEESGLEPGPFAHHAFVFACVKAGRPDEGLETMRNMFEQGMQFDLWFEVLFRMFSIGCLVANSMRGNYLILQD